MIKCFKSLKLVYRGSQDSFKSEYFRLKCSDLKTTLIIAYSKEFNKVFGGYTDIPWSKTGNFGVSKSGGGKSFIFSVSD